MSDSQVQGLAIAIFGAVCISFSKRFGTQASAFQRRVFGVELTPRSLELGYLFGGVAFCLLGVLALIGMVEFGQ